MSTKEREKPASGTIESPREIEEGITKHMGSFELVGVRSVHAVSRLGKEYKRKVILARSMGNNQYYFLLLTYDSISTILAMLELNPNLKAFRFLKNESGDWIIVPEKI